MKGWKLGMIVFSIIGTLFTILGIVLLFDLTPERITEDILRFVYPKQSLKAKVKAARGKKKSSKLTMEIRQIHEALTATGKDKQFATVCSVSLILFVCGAVFAVLVNNIFLVPCLAVALALLPFIHAKTTIGYYEKHLEEEIETALSVITTSYIRNSDIVTAVRENIPYLKPPVVDIFKSFLGEVTSVNADIKKALIRLKDKINNDIFKEWVDTLIQCQDDRTMNDTLLSIVSKLSDVRMVNNELQTMLYEPKKEFYLMVVMLLGNIPLLYMLNRDWFETLVFTIPGKFVLALCGGGILVTTLLMRQYTKPIVYKK